MDQHAHFYRFGSLRASALPSLWTTFLLVGLLLNVVNADDCSVEPLVLSIRNVTFYPDGIAENRGVCLVLGGQIQGLRMSTTLNNTRVRNALDCPPTSDISGLVGCEGSSGSVYNTTAGSFKPVYNLKDWNVSVIDPRPTDGTTVIQGYDNATFPDGPSVIPDFPFEVWANHDALNKSALAMGPKSSVLKHLVDAGLAPSSAFGIDYGSRSEAHPRDGQLIVGGDNGARYDGNTKAQFTMWGAAAPVNCPLQVLLADVVLINDSGNHSLFEDPDSKVTACVDTIQNAFTFTPTMFAKWQSLTGWIASDGSAYSEQSYPLDREHLIGTLAIKLANGYTSAIPHYELVTHERGTDMQGKYVVTNTSRVMAAVLSGESDLGDNVPILGGVFLSQNYLHVDYAGNSFWLSPQVGNGTFPNKITTSCTPSNSTNGGSDGSGGSGNLNLGLKIGLPVAFVVVALGLVAGFMSCRRRRQSGPINGIAIVDEDGGENGIVPRAPRGVGLHGDGLSDRRVSEMQGLQLPLHEDVVVEVGSSSSSPRINGIENRGTVELDGSCDITDQGCHK